MALLLGRWPRAATVCGAGTALLACGVGLVPAVQVLQRGWLLVFSARGLPVGGLPGVADGSLVLEIDALTAFFLLPVFGLCGLGAIYGGEYLLAYRREKNLGAAWFFYNLLVASMALVLTARNAVLFLVAWEVMSIASFFLVTFEHEKESVRQAGWTYLVATHIGTAFLIVMFVVLGVRTGSFDFADFGRAAGAVAGVADVLFACAVIGFGTKAGFMPLHVWLPEAHPAAPSHVSAVMSGVMIKTGIYGLLRMLTYLGAPPAWWGWLLVGVGVTSGVLGVLFALAQHDLKRMLAYSSVENIGIITMSLGLGLLGLAHDRPVAAVLGFGGALLHVINHAAFKGLLFLGAGAVLHGTGMLEIDRLGGLLKRLPIVGLTFVVGAVAICGLPPLNGFAGELLIYVAALRGAAMRGTEMAVPSVAVIAGLALIGGLAAACFAKAFGMAFLGEPRSEQATHVHRTGVAMLAPMFVLMAACICLGIFGPLVVGRLTPVVVDAAMMPAEPVTRCLDQAAGNLAHVVIVAMALIVLVVLLTVWRQWMLRKRTVGEAGTWDCGYARPTARMQYTASSFAQPLTHVFRALLRTRMRFDRPEGLFPREGRLSTETPDVFTENVYRPAFLGIGWAVSKLRWLQQGRVQLYVLYIAATLLALLVWKLG